MIDIARESADLSMKDVARMLRVTPKTARLWARKGLLESVRAGGARRTSQAAVQRFLKQNDDEPAGQITFAPVRSDYEESMRALKERHGAK